MALTCHKIYANKDTKIVISIYFFLNQRQIQIVDNIYLPYNEVLPMR